MKVDMPLFLRRNLLKEFIFRVHYRTTPKNLAFLDKNPPHAVLHEEALVLRSLKKQPRAGFMSL